MLIALNEATASRRRIPVALVATDPDGTGVTGQTLSAGDLKLSKNGGAEANHGGTWTELAGGDYYYECTAGEVDTLGYLTGRITKSGARTFRFLVQVTAVLASDGAVVSAASKSGYSLASGGIPAGAHAAAELNAMADAILDRNLGTGTDSGTDSTAVRTVRQALRRLRNREAIAAGTGTVYKEDDATASWTYAATTAAGNPLSEVNPT